MTVAYLSHSDCGFHDTGWNHPEHVGRLRAIPRALREDFELFSLVQHVEGRHATEAEAAIAHDAAYVARVRELAECGGGRLDPDTVVSEGSWKAATAGLGCVLDGVDMAFDGRAVRSFSAVRPPGHHALRARGIGDNDIAWLGSYGQGNDLLRLLGLPQDVFNVSAEDRARAAERGKDSPDETTYPEG